jgi:protein-S-isoprenylcysteine O-methyltransferase Ste14
MTREASTLTPRLARFGRVVFPRRLWVGLLVVGLAAFLVEPRALPWPWQAASLALVLLGLAGRAWAAGCAGRHTREARIEAPRLVTGGPFAHVRNPIYLASILLGFGMVGLVGDPWLLALHLGVCVLLYAGIVPAEEQFLREKFGRDYLRYCAHVPRLWPRMRAWEGAQPADYDGRAWLDQARLALILAAIYAGLHGAAWLRG